MQSFDASQYEKAVIGSGYGSTGILDKRKLLIKIGIIGSQKPHDHIRMTTNKLGHRMHDHISTQIQWILQIRGSKSVVDDQFGLMFFRNSGQSFNVHNVHHRIGRGFRPDKFGFVGHGSFYLYQVFHIHESELDTEFLKYFGKQPEGSAIQVVGTYHFITRSQSFDDRFSGTHSGSKTLPVFSIFQCCQVGLQHLPGWVLGTRVFIALVLTRCILNVGAGLKNRGHDSPG